MNKALNPGHDTRARIRALMPVLHDRYDALIEVLDAAAQGADVPDWDLDLARADLLTVLMVIHPAAAGELLAGPPPGDAEPWDLTG